MALDYEGARGMYDVLPVRVSDVPPDEASHAVFAEDGYLAGFVCASVAWDALSRVIGYADSLMVAVAMVAAADV